MDRLHDTRTFEGSRPSPFVQAVRRAAVHRCALEAFARAEPGLRVLVVAAHPDDETIGVGATLASFVAAGFVVRVAHATDGAPHDAALRGSLARLTPSSAAAARRAEERAALQAGGLDADEVLLPTLGFVDQEAALDLVALTRAVTNLFAAVRPDVVITHPYEGGHPDHDAVAFAVHGAAARAEEAPAIAEMSSYFAAGPHGPMVTGTFAAAARGCSGPPRRGLLDGGDRARRRRMLAAFVTQASVLVPFSDASEPLRCAPDYDFSRPPPGAGVWYETLPFGWTAATFCAEAVRAAAALGSHDRP